MASVINHTVPHGTTPLSAGDIDFRTEGYCVAQFLKYARNTIIFDRFAQRHPIPRNKNTKIMFRRPKPLPLATTPIVEGVSPDGVKLEFEDVSGEIHQYGSNVRITDRLLSVHEDGGQMIKTIMQLCGEQAADTMEKVRIASLSSGTNVFLASGATSRANIANKVTSTDLKKVYRTFRRNKAKFMTEVVSASARISTQPIGRCYIAVAHIDLANDLRSLPDFIPTEKYAQDKALEGEIGKVGDFRILLSDMIDVKPGAGATVSDGSLITTNGKADVYPIYLFGRDAYGDTPLQGESAAHISVIQPGKATKDDPNGLLGFVSWTTWMSSMILNQDWFARLEVGCGEL